MDNAKMLNETGEKVFEELKKQTEQLSENKNTKTSVSASMYLADIKLTDEEFQALQPDGTLQENFKKALGKFRSEKIKLDMEIIEHKKGD